MSGHRKTLTRSPQLCLALALAACTDPQAVPLQFVTWVSDGVEVIEIPLATDQSVEQWSLSTNAVTVVGSTDGNEADILENVPSARWIDDGSLIVANRGGAPGVRQFAADGTFLRRMGSHGQGPGEFVAPSAILDYRGDSIAIWDPAQWRITVITKEGVVGRVVRLSAAARIPMLNIRVTMPDGGFVGSRSGYTPSRPNRKNGWEMSPVIRLDEKGELVKTLGEFPLIETARNSLGYASAVLLGGTGRLLHTRSGFAWARTDIGEVRFYDPNGALQRIVRLHGERRLITDAEWDRYVKALWGRQVAQNPQMGTWTIEDLRSRPRARMTPLLSECIEVEGRSLWVRTFSFPWETEARLLRVDLETGRIATLRVPSAAKVMDISHDRILLLRLDEFDVPYLETYAFYRAVEEEGSRVRRAGDTIQ
ncbi:MAG: hypothetical protein JW940_37775 [Polyangiaceae bacterium]|nr:hypothetical protein [Polyangiaceae bacterium]